MMETNVNNHQAERRYHADSSDLESTDGEESTHTEKHKVEQENYCKHKRDKLGKLEQELVHSQNLLKSLKRHLERQTCLKSLQYRASIKVDSEFRRDIKCLTKKAEQEYVICTSTYKVSQLKHQRPLNSYNTRT